MKIRNAMLSAIAAMAMASSPREEALLEARAAKQPGPAVRTYRAFRRSRYMPHIGKKERARHAGRPDGPMHGLPPLFRANQP